MKNIIQRIIINQAKKRRSIDFLQMVLQLLCGVFLYIALTISIEKFNFTEKMAKIMPIILALYTILVWVNGRLCQKIVKKVEISAYKSTYGFYNATNHKMLLGENGLIHLYEMEAMPKGLKVAASRQEIHAVSAIEYHAHKGTVRQEDLRRKFDRNYSIALRNPNANLMIMQDDVLVGVTQMVPVTSDTWHSFQRGEISSVEFSNMHATEDEKFAGVIIRITACIGKNSKIEKYEILYEAILFHLHQFLKGKDTIKVILPTCDDMFVKPLVENGFVKLAIKTKDNIPMYIAELKNSMDTKSTDKSESNSELNEKKVGLNVSFDKNKNRRRSA